MKTISILIIGGDVIADIELKRSVERLGYHVLEVVSFRDSPAEKVRRLRPELIMVNDDGEGNRCCVKIARDLRQQSGKPVIVLTDDITLETVLQKVLSPPIVCLLKPVDPKTLTIIAKMTVGQHRANQGRDGDPGSAN